MARAAQRSSGPGFVGMIIFLVLTVILAGACVFLGLGFSKRGASLTLLQQRINTDLEVPLRKSGLEVSAHPTVSASDIAYDDAFFNKVKDNAVLGMDFKKLSNKIGLGVDNPIDLINTELTKQGQDTLWAYINKLVKDLGDTRRRLDEANTALQLANAQTKEAQDLQKAANEDLKKARDEKDQKLAEQKSAFDKEMDATKALKARADADAKKAYDDLRAQSDAHKKEIADLQSKILKLTNDLASANEELKRKAPKAVAVTEGKILQAQSGIVIINLGKREAIQNGEKFTVVRLGKGGERVPKGELQVIRVEDTVSTTEVLDSDPNDPIMRDDIVQREKKTE